MARRRNSIAKLGVLCVVLLVALGVIGGTYGLWSDTLNIIGMVRTGTYGAELSEFTCSDPISCWLDLEDPHILHVKVTDAEAGHEYDCGFTISNSGTIPVKIQSIVFPSSPAEGVTVEITGVGVGDQIDPGPGGAKDGTVHVSLAEGASTTFNFTVTISFIPWNQYVPPP